MQSQPSLPALAKAGSEFAQFYFNLRRMAYYGALIVALCMLLPVGSFAYVLAVAAMIIEVLAWWFRNKGEHYHSLSRELMRRAMLCNAFGQCKESLDITDLLNSFGEEKLRKKAEQLEEKFNYQENYYSTEKLLDNIQESAFWSKHLFESAAQRSFLALMLIFFMVIAVFFLINPLVISQDMSLIPSIIVVFFAFVIADELSTAFAWQDAAKRCDTLDRRLEKILAEVNNPSEEVILAIFSDYAVATAAAPPIPKRIYEKHWDHLEQSWKDRMAARQTINLRNDHETTTNS
jgi:ABC-type multidrug transport system fused ATPase/permease subunit